ncbi:MAG: hypothetical protein IT210_20155 [Armatimonadetes bacterium]|nr:hypothetical protein [Armatimonadota bacterium]
MSRGRQVALLCVIGCVLCMARAHSQGRRILVLDGKAAQLTVDIGGGSFADFHLNGQGLNPFRVEDTGPSPEPRPMGHFLCLDRWGAPTEAEAKNGMPFHGEAANVMWQALGVPVEVKGHIRAEMSAALPLAGLKVQRRIALSTTSPVFVVTESVTNANPLGRLFNMVQHPTIGPPFLDERTLVDAGAGRGFVQNSPQADPRKSAASWPLAVRAGRKVNLRFLKSDPEPALASFAVKGPLGWVVASNPARGLLIGYVWKTADYPWLNIWRAADRGRPLARGLEFGTTGMHQPFPVLTATGRLFGLSLYGYLDAGQTVTKTFACFLLNVPGDYRGVARLACREGRLTLYERPGRPQRTLSLKVSDLFPEGG